MSVDLTDVESVRQFMQKSVSDKIQDVDIETLIVQASGAIQRYCNREFAPASAPATRSFEFLTCGNGWDLIDLSPYEYRAVEEVKLDPDLEVPIVLPAAQYRVWPVPSRDGTYFGLRLAGIEEPPGQKALKSSPAVPFQTRRLDVKARWGMLEVPDEVRNIANRTVESWLHLRRDGGMPVGQEFGEVPVGRSYDFRPACARWVRPTPAV